MAHNPAFEPIGRELSDVLSAPEIAERTENVGELERHIESIRSKAQQGGGENVVERMHSRGFLTSDERIGLLVDEGTKFLPFYDFAGYGYKAKDGKQSPRAAVITGIGKVHGRNVMVIANDNTTNLGAWLQPTIEKIIRAETMADKLGIPVAWMVDSVGLNLTEPYNSFAGQWGGGRIFGKQAELLDHSKTYQIAGVFGASIAGGGYNPIASDIKFMSERAYMVIGGASLIQSAFRGDKIGPLEYAGVDVHKHLSGCITGRAPEDRTVIKFMRDAIKDTPDQTNYYRKMFRSHKTVHEPFYNPNEIGLVVPHSKIEEFFDMREVIARLTDNSLFQEVDRYNGQELITGYGLISGLPVGIVANNPNPTTHPYTGEMMESSHIYERGAKKAIRFVQDCSKSAIPLLFIQDVLGFNMGEEPEMNGLLADGYGFIWQHIQSHVPTMSLLLRNARGAGYYGMAGESTGSSWMELSTYLTNLMVMDPIYSAKAAMQADYNRSNRARKKLLGNGVSITDDEYKAWQKARTKLRQKTYRLADQTRKESTIEKMAGRMHFDELVGFNLLKNYVNTFVESSYQSGRLNTKNFSILPAHARRMDRRPGGK